MLNNTKCIEVGSTVEIETNRNGSGRRKNESSMTTATAKDSENNVLRFESMFDKAECSNINNNVETETCFESGESDPYSSDSGSNYEPHADLEVSDDFEYGENGSNNNENLEVPEPLPKRKRAKKADVNKMNWNRARNKTKRMIGENYVSAKFNKTNKSYEPVEKGERKLGRPCNCRISGKSRKYFCREFTEEDRAKIFKTFWKCMTWAEKKVYVLALIDRIPVKQRKTGRISE